MVVDSKLPATNRAPSTRAQGVVSGSQHLGAKHNTSSKDGAKDKGFEDIILRLPSANEEELLM